MDVGKLAEILPQVRLLAEEAGHRILEECESGYEVFEKPDGSPVTTADLVAHECIAAGLPKIAEGWPLVSEEAEPVAWQTRRQWQTYWLVDPLDGTRELLKGSPEFTVNIALIHEQQPVLGVIGVPALGLGYHAHLGGGAFRCEEGEADCAIAARTAPQDASFTVAARHHYAGAQIRSLLERLGAWQERRIGSSLKSCRVAEGSLDLYPRYGPTSEWDTAAAQCIVEEAGGALIDWQLHPLRYNRKASLLNPSFMAVGDRDYDWARLLDGLSGRAVSPSA